MTPLRRFDLEKLIVIYLKINLPNVTPKNKVERKGKIRKKKERKNTHIHYSILNIYINIYTSISILANLIKKHFYIK
jgi:hypothetical protein